MDAKRYAKINEHMETDLQCKRMYAEIRKQAETLGKMIALNACMLKVDDLTEKDFMYYMQCESVALMHNAIVDSIEKS